jgi:thiol-disulfide isomerase/thioredoxin
LCLGLAGCQLFGLGKRSKAGADPLDRPGGAAGGLRSDPGGRAAADAADTSALLAGRIIDSFNQRPQKTFIQVVALREGPEEPAAPVEVEVGPEGYFAVPGLKRGRHYQLIARVRDGDKTVMAGTTYATPPDPRVVIRISEDFVSRETPAAPGEPAWPGGKGTPKDRADARSPAAGLDRPVVPKPGTTTPPGSFAAPPGGPVQLGTPNPNSSGAASPSTSINPRPEDLVDPRNPMVASTSPITSVNPQTPNATIRPPTTPFPATPSPPTTTNNGELTAQSGIPFCRMKDNATVDNFGLYDLDGQPWEFRGSPHGRLVLLDFWGSWCVPCQRAVPHLVQLQQRYRAWGLDVVGIAYEYEGTPQQQAQRVKGLRDRMQINYRLLLGGGIQACPVKGQLGVEEFPTLVLLDEYGHILWRSSGLDEFKRHQLEAEIKWRLNVR